MVVTTVPLRIPLVLSNKMVAPAKMPFELFRAVMVRVAVSFPPVLTDVLSQFKLSLAAVIGTAVGAAVTVGIAVGVGVLVPLSLPQSDLHRQVRRRRKRLALC